MALGDFSTGTRRILLKNPLNTFLFFAAIFLAVAFFTLLRSIGPSSYGAQIPISAVETLTQHKEISKAVLLDHDNRVEITTVAREGELPRLEWASYPGSGAQTQELITALSKSGATVVVDEQAGKSLRTIVVQFLIPILLLVTLFALLTRIGADGGAGGIAGFSAFTGKGKRKGKGTKDSVTFADVAGAGEAVAELREIRDYLNDPGRYLERRCGRSEGSAAGRAARHRQDAAGQGGRRRGGCLVLLAVGVGLR